MFMQFMEVVFYEGTGTTSTRQTFIRLDKISSISQLEEGISLVKTEDADLRVEGNAYKLRNELEIKISDAMNFWLKRMKAVSSE